MTKKKPTALVPAAPAPLAPRNLFRADKRTPEEKLEDALASLWQTLGESADTARAYKYDWGVWTKWLAEHGGTPLEARAVHVQMFLNHMRERGLAKSTRARMLSVLKQVYAALVVGEALDMNPAREAKNLRVDSTPKAPWLVDTELAKLLAYPNRSTWIDRRDWLVLCVLIGTGLRRKNVATLAVEQLVPAPGGGMAANVKAKGGKQASIRVPSWLAEELLAWIADRKIESGSLFDISPGTVYNIVKRTAARVGVSVERSTPHAMRRSFTTETGNRGVSLESRQAALLHSNRATTEIYDKADRASSQAPGEVLANLVGKRK